MAKKEDMVTKHIAALEKMKGFSVEAGWFESAVYPNGTSVARVARVQEFGAAIKRGKGVIIIPARPFMRLAYTRIKQKMPEVQKKIARRMIEGKIQPQQALSQIGLFMEGEIVASIKNGGWAPNAPSTVKRKGFDKPLIDTAQMWQSVASKVSDPS